MRAYPARFAIVVALSAPALGCSTAGKSWSKIWPWSSTASTAMPPGSSYSSTQPTLPPGVNSSLPSSGATPSPLANNYGGGAGGSYPPSASRAPGVAGGYGMAGAPGSAGAYGGAPTNYSIPPSYPNAATAEPYGPATMAYGNNPAGAAAYGSRSSIAPQNTPYNPSGYAGAGAGSPAALTAAAPASANPATRYASGNGGYGQPMTNGASYTGAGATPNAATGGTGYAPPNTSGGATASGMSVPPPNTSGYNTASTASRVANGAYPTTTAGGIAPPGSPPMVMPAAATGPAASYRPGSTGMPAASPLPGSIPPAAPSNYGRPTVPPGQPGPATVYPQGNSAYPAAYPATNSLPATTPPAVYSGSQYVGPGR